MFEKLRLSVAALDVCTKRTKETLEILSQFFGRSAAEKRINDQLREKGRQWVATGLSAQSFWIFARSAYENVLNIPFWRKTLQKIQIKVYVGRLWVAGQLQEGRG